MATSAATSARREEEIAMKSLAIAFIVSLLAPACLVHAREDDYAVRAFAVSVEGPRCHPSRYWNGERCVRKGYHYHHHRWHHN